MNLFATAFISSPAWPNVTAHIADEPPNTDRDDGGAGPRRMGAGASAIGSNAERDPCCSARRSERHRTIG